MTPRQALAYARPLNNADFRGTATRQACTRTERHRKSGLWLHTILAIDR